ncbi:28S ribosomal protein S31, mitochondrial [Varanus komodoensis]|uniref:Small ribosomal subunit protein mS31 n=1 Tax=Varanus komodoensis TaxID=61221 RepID=A0A8D2JBF9_VARKO|nr:28S ribosomal protein S31, mitochondrial [Varanus komodoensis]KAF7239863.1 28S ribosomal protein S31, mitochondrial [Varanus komodoensis]
MWRRSLSVPGGFCAALRLGAHGRGLSAPDSKTHRFVGTSPVFCTKEDESVSCTDTKTIPNQEKKTKPTVKNLLDIVRKMKVDVSMKEKLQRLKAEKTKEETRESPGNVESASNPFQVVTDTKAMSDAVISPKLVAAASAVASSLPFDRKRTVSELVQMLRQHKEITEARRSGETTDISNIVVNMKIGRRPSRDTSRASDIQFDEDGRGYSIERDFSSKSNRTKRVSLFSAKRLGIFTHSKMEMTPETVTTPTLWDVELAKEIAAVSQQALENAFEEMIQWTKEGKLWEFPITNEAGLEEDAEFYEHVFLDKYLADFPKEGPIHHFMELVTCGLSKNPYLSVKEKVEHIEWFRDYFKEKEELLKEIEAHEKEILITQKNLSE